MEDEILATLRHIHAAKERDCPMPNVEKKIHHVSVRVGDLVINGVVSEDTHLQLIGSAKIRKLTREELLIEAYTLKGSIDDEAVYSYLFGDPRT